MRAPTFTRTITADCRIGRHVYRANGVVIDGFTISNGDDAVAIQSGAANVLVQNGFVGHHSHGMSIGSLGQNQGLFASVSNVGPVRFPSTPRSNTADAGFAFRPRRSRSGTSRWTERFMPAVSSPGSADKDWCRT